MHALRFGSRQSGRSSGRRQVAPQPQLGALEAMVGVGRMTQLVDNRVLIGGGFVTLAIAPRLYPAVLLLKRVVPPGGPIAVH